MERWRVERHRGFESLRFRSNSYQQEEWSTISYDFRAVIEEMREEGEGSRGAFYEAWGSGISNLLLPLAELLEDASDSNPELVEKITRGLYNGYID